MRISSFYSWLSRGASKSTRYVPILNVPTIGVGIDEPAQIVTSPHVTPSSRRRQPSSQVSCERAATKHEEGEERKERNPFTLGGSYK